MKSFKVSIILPVYNVEKYLSACLDSLLAQTLEEIEIVAVNDGSTDGSLQILQAYQSLNPEKLFIFSTENHGVSRARNYGFAHSHGEYVWFVDSDDFVEPDACRLLYEKATADGNDLVLFRYYNVDSETGVRKEYIASCHNQNFRVADKPYLRFLHTHGSSSFTEICLTDFVSRKESGLKIFRWPIFWL